MHPSAWPWQLVWSRGFSQGEVSTWKVSASVLFRCFLNVNLLSAEVRGAGSQENIWFLMEQSLERLPCVDEE